MVDEHCWQRVKKELIQGKFDGRVLRPPCNTFSIGVNEMEVLCHCVMRQGRNDTTANDA